MIVKLTKTQADVLKQMRKGNMLLYLPKTSGYKVKNTKVSDLTIYSLLNKKLIVAQKTIYPNYDDYSITSLGMNAEIEVIE
jgi:hypothetical protein